MRQGLTIATSFSASRTQQVVTKNSARGKFGFLLFLLLNAVLFIRPGEVVPALVGMPIYEVVIVSCTLASIPAIVERLSWASLSRNLASVCVVGMLPAVVISHVSHGNLYDAREAGSEFGKVLLYYLLLLSSINSFQRLRVFLLSILVFIGITATLALLQYHEVIHIEALTQYDQGKIDEETGDATGTMRLQASGVFSDPNDFSLILAAGMLLAGHMALRSATWLKAIAWFLPIPYLGYAFALTNSRGGFLAIIAGSMTMVFTRWGWRRAILIAAVALPIAVWLFGGRQTDIDLGDAGDTAQGRIQLWRDSLVMFHSNPIRGIGYGMVSEEIGHPTHNSFIHAFTELGLIGGTLFAGAFYVSVEGLRRAGSPAFRTRDAAMAFWQPCILSIVVAYAVGICSLSRLYAVPSYFILGLSTAFLALVHTPHLAAVCHTHSGSIKRVVVAAAVCLLFFEVFVRLFAQ